MRNAHKESKMIILELQKVNYDSLNARQKETFNFQKVSSILADYGFATIKLNDDWNGADFISQHIDGKTFLKVQLKSRLTFDRKYLGADLFICFPYKSDWYLFHHDSLLNLFLSEYENRMAVSKSWLERGQYTWNTLSSKILIILKPFKLD